jgi:hypothetical protein
MVIGIVAAAALACMGPADSPDPRPVPGGKPRRRRKGEKRRGGDGDVVDWPEFAVGEVGVTGELTEADRLDYKYWNAKGTHRIPFRPHSVQLKGGKIYTAFIWNLEDTQRGKLKGMAPNVDVYETAPDGHSIEQMWDEDEVEYPGIGGGVKYWYDRSYIRAERTGLHAVLVFSGYFDDEGLQASETGRYRVQILPGKVKDPH